MNQAETRPGSSSRAIYRYATPTGLRFKVFPTNSAQPLKQCKVGETVDKIAVYSPKSRLWTDNEKLNRLLTANFFGFNPNDSGQHFQVDIPIDENAPVGISHFLEWAGEPTEPDDNQRRVELSRAKWEAIAEATAREFNARLRRLHEWRPGHNLLCRQFGQELTLLAWAIEDADHPEIETAIANWLGLEPPERWWLYSQTAAATGHWQRGRNKGWRKAVRFALTENPT